ncbi:hypothetical protein RDI58_021111 [Solanum bulbocastanum]
MALLQ